MDEGSASLSVVSVSHSRQLFLDDVCHDSICSVTLKVLDRIESSVGQ